MSYIVRSGNLAGPITLKTTDDGLIQGRVTVMVNDQSRDDSGVWATTATTGYRLTLRGRAAQRLAELQKRAGNISVIFTGNYRVRTYTSTDGSSRLSHDVWVDDIGANIAIHDLTLLKTENTANTVKTVNAGDYAKAGESPDNQPAPTLPSSTTAQTQGIRPSNHNAIPPQTDFSTAATNAVNAGKGAAIPPVPDPDLWAINQTATDNPY